jgi:hypothetical protein
MQCLTSDMIIENPSPSSNVIQVAFEQPRSHFLHPVKGFRARFGTHGPGHGRYRHEGNTIFVSRITCPTQPLG